MNQAQIRQNGFQSQQFFPILQNPMSMPQQMIKVPQFNKIKLQNEQLQFSNSIPFKDQKVFSQVTKVASPRMQELKQMQKSLICQPQTSQNLNQFYLANNLPKNKVTCSSLKGSKYQTVNTESYQENKKNSFEHYSKMLNLEEKVEQLVNENERLNDIIKQLSEKQIEKIINDKANQLTTKNNNNNNNSNFSQQVDELQNKFEQLENLNRILSEETIKNQEKISKYKKDLEGEISQVGKLAKQNQELKEQLDDRNQKIIYYQEDRNKLLQQQIETNKLNEIQIQFRQLESKNNFLNEENLKLLQQIQEKEKTIMRFSDYKQENSKNANQQLEQEIEKLKMQINELNLKITEQQTNNELQEELIQNLNSEVSQLSSNNLQTEKEKLKLYQQQILEQNQEIQMLKTLLNKKTSELSETTAPANADNKEEIQNQIESLTQKNNELNCKLNEALNQVKKANNNSSKWQTKYKQFKQAMKKIVNINEKNTESKIE